MIENRRAAPLRTELEGGSHRSSDAGSCEGVCRYTDDFRRGNRTGIRHLAGLYAPGGFAGKLGTLAGKDADGGFAGKLERSVVPSRSVASLGNWEPSMEARALDGAAPRGRAAAWARVSPEAGTLGGKDAVGGFAAGEGFIEKLGAVVGDACGEKVALPRRGGIGAAAQGIERLRELRRA